MEIAVVGAGIAGLTASLALAKNGFKVRLYEAAPAWAEIGAGITLSPNAMCGLMYAGVGDAVVDCGVQPVQQQINHWQDGRALVTINRQDTLETYGYPYVYIHRADLHEIMTDAVEKAGVQIHLGKYISSVDLDGVRPKMIFADGSVDEAELIVAADGLKSQIRKLFSNQPAHFTGHIAYRAVASTSDSIQPMIDQPGVHIGPGKMITRYPLRKGKLLNLVFFARQQGWTEEGWSIPADIDELKSLYSDWCPDVQRMLGAVAAGSTYKWAINAHQPLEGGWSLDDKVTIIGDAAHAMTPFLGQGAAAAIEDAVILARSLATTASVTDALSIYYDSRYTRTSFMQTESHANADRMQGDEAEMFGLGNIRNEETLGLFWYNCGTEPLGNRDVLGSMPESMPESTAHLHFTKNL